MTGVSRRRFAEPRRGADGIFMDFLRQRSLTSTGWSAFFGGILSTGMQNLLLPY